MMVIVFSNQPGNHISLLSRHSLQALNAQSRAMLMAKLDRSGIASRFVSRIFSD